MKIRSLILATIFCASVSYGQLSTKIGASTVGVNYLKAYIKGYIAVQDSIKFLSFLESTELASPPVVPATGNTRLYTYGNQLWVVNSSGTRTNISSPIYTITGGDAWTTAGWSRMLWLRQNSAAIQIGDSLGSWGIGNASGPMGNLFFFRTDKNDGSLAPRYMVQFDSSGSGRFFESALFGKNLTVSDTLFANFFVPQQRLDSVYLNNTQIYQRMLAMGLGAGGDGHGVADTTKIVFNDRENTIHENLYFTYTGSSVPQVSINLGTGDRGTVTVSDNEGTITAGMRPDYIGVGGSGRNAQLVFPSRGDPEGAPFVDTIATKTMFQDTTELPINGIYAGMIARGLGVGGTDSSIYASKSFVSNEYIRIGTLGTAAWMDSARVASLDKTQIFRGSGQTFYGSIIDTGSYIHSYKTIIVGSRGSTTGSLEMRSSDHTVSGRLGLFPSRPIASSAVRALFLPDFDLTNSSSSADTLVSKKSLDSLTNKTLGVGSYYKGNRVDTLYLDNTGIYNRMLAMGLGAGFDPADTLKIDHTLQIGSGGYPKILFDDPDGGHQGTLGTDVLTADRAWTLPNKDGTFAMLSDVTGAPADSNYYMAEIDSIYALANSRIAVMDTLDLHKPLMMNGSILFGLTGEPHFISDTNVTVAKVISLASGFGVNVSSSQGDITLTADSTDVLSIARFNNEGSKVGHTHTISQITGALDSLTALWNAIGTYAGTGGPGGSTGDTVKNFATNVIDPPDSVDLDIRGGISIFGTQLFNASRQFMGIVDTGNINLTNLEAWINSLGLGGWTPSDGISDSLHFADDAVIAFEGADGGITYLTGESGSSNFTIALPAKSGTILVGSDTTWISNRIDALTNPTVPQDTLAASTVLADTVNTSLAQQAKANTKTVFPDSVQVDGTLTTTGAINGERPWTTLRRTADTTIAGTNATILDIGDLMFNMTANKRYEVRGAIYVASDTLTTGVQIHAKTGTVAQIMLRGTAPSSATAHVWSNITSSTDSIESVHAIIKSRIYPIEFVGSVTCGASNAIFKLGHRREMVSMGQAINNQYIYQESWIQYRLAN